MPCEIKVRFPVHANTKSGPDIVKRFIAIAGVSCWKKKWDILDEKMDRARFLIPYITKRHHIELSVRRLYSLASRYRRWPKSFESGDYEALSLMAAVYKIHQQLSGAGRNRLKGAVLSALNKNSYFLPFEFEVSMAINLIVKGFDVQFVDYENLENFDFLACKDDVSIEVECKTASYDKGRKIHREHLHSVYRQLESVFVDSCNAQRDWNLIVIELIGRMPSRKDDQAKIVQSVRQLTEGSRSEIRCPWGSVRSASFILPANPTEDQLRRISIEATGRDAHSIFLPGQNPLMVTAYSTSLDRPLQVMEKELKKASRQLKGQHPGILFFYIDEIDPWEWESLKDDSALAKMTQIFLSSQNRSHVHSVVYTSQGITLRQPGVTSGMSVTLAFRNPNSKEYDNPVLKKLTASRGRE